MLLLKIKVFRNALHGHHDVYKILHEILNTENETLKLPRNISDGLFSNYIHV